MRWTWLGLVCVGGWTGCAGGGGPLCEPGRDPTLEIGLGVGAFTPVADGDPMPLIHGPQGGWHLEIGLLATHIDAGDLITGSLEGTIDGERVAISAPWLDMRCDEEAGGLVSWSTRLIYPTETSEELDGLTTEITASVTDLRGITVSTSRTFVIQDEAP